MNISLKQKQSIIIPQKANRTFINGKTYATDINGKGLYCLISNNKNENEGYIIDKTFSIKYNAYTEITFALKNHLT